MAVGKKFGEEAAPTDACTVMAWIQYREKIKTDLFQFHPGDPWDNRISVHFPWAEAGIIWQFGRPFGGPPGVDIPKNFEDDWHHVAFTGSDESTEIWIDGEDVARGGGQQPFVHQAHGPWHVGGRTNASFDGKIDEVGFFDVALSEKDINTIVDQGLESTILGVDPAGKVATGWGTIKARD